MPYLMIFSSRVHLRCHDACVQIVEVIVFVRNNWETMKLGIVCENCETNH